MAKANNWTLNLPRQQVAVNEWDAGHSVKAHEGFTLRSGEEAPARPWVYRTADEYDFAGNLTKAIAKQNTDLASAIKTGFVEMATDFGESMQQNIQDPIWEWPRVTRRQNGEVVGSPRNIVDTEELLNSYSIKIK